jgi:hypothetical protein
MLLETLGGGGLGSGSFFFLNKKSATDLELIPVSFEISLNIDETDGGGGLNKVLSVIRLYWGADIIDSGGGLFLGAGIMIRFSTGIAGCIGLIIGGSSLLLIGVGTLTAGGNVAGRDTLPLPITLTSSFENTGNSTGALMLVGVPKLCVGAVGANPLDD